MSHGQTNEKCPNQLFIEPYPKLWRLKNLNGSWLVNEERVIRFPIFYIGPNHNQPAITKSDLHNLPVLQHFSRVDRLGQRGRLPCPDPFARHKPQCASLCCPELKSPGDPVRMSPLWSSSWDSWTQKDRIVNKNSSKHSPREENTWKNPRCTKVTSHAGNVTREIMCGLLWQISERVSKAAPRPLLHF